MHWPSARSARLASQPRARLPLHPVSQDCSATTYPRGNVPCHDLLKARTTCIEDLIALAQREDLDKTEGGPIYSAVVLLGRLRATEAVPFLSKRISYLPPLYGGVFRGTPAAMGTYYPCAVALAEIGEPCLYSMDYVIRMGETKLERDLAAWVMMQVEGKDVALYRLDALTKKPYVKNYEEAKDFIANYKPVLRHPLIPAARWEQMEHSKPDSPTKADSPKNAN